MLNALDYKFPNQAIVAANLLQPDAQKEFICKIISESNTHFRFMLDLDAKTGYSKGDWIWVTEVTIESGDIELITIPVIKRIVDIPYCRNKVSAYCLLKNFRPELIATVKKELNI